MADDRIYLQLRRNANYAESRDSAIALIEQQLSGSTHSGEPYICRWQDSTNDTQGILFGVANGDGTYSYMDIAEHLDITEEVAAALSAHMARNDNPHGVTKEQVGLGNVDNIPDMDKPISTLQQAALDTKLNNAANGGIADNLTTNSSTIALSAAQGIVLQGKIDEITGGAAADLTQLENRVSGVEEEISGATEYIDATLMPLAQQIHADLTI